MSDMLPAIYVHCLSLPSAQCCQILSSALPPCFLWPAWWVATWHFHPNSSSQCLTISSSQLSLMSHYIPFSSQLSPTSHHLPSSSSANTPVCYFHALVHPFYQWQINNVTQPATSRMGSGYTSIVPHHTHNPLPSPPHTILPIITIIIITITTQNAFCLSLKEDKSVIPTLLCVYCVISVLISLIKTHACFLS